MKIINKLSEELKKLSGNLPETKQEKEIEKEKQPRNQKKRTLSPQRKIVSNHQAILAFQKKLDTNFAKGEIEKYFPDKFPLATNDPYYAIHPEIHKLIFSELIK